MKGEINDSFNPNRTMRQAAPINTPVCGTEVHQEDESVIQTPLPTGQQCVIRGFTRTKTSLTQFNSGDGAASKWTNHVMKAKIQLSLENTVNGIEASDDPNSAKSRTGYIMTIANCPVLWVSKLQTEIALSILESEFIALSSSFRSLIPVKRLIEETRSGLDITTQVQYSAKSTLGSSKTMQEHYNWQLPSD